MEQSTFDQALAQVIAGFPEIAAAYLFGSFARGEAGPDSDVDIGLVFRRRGDTALSHHRMLGDLASRLEQVIPGHPVDLVVLEPQGPVFCHEVLLNGRLVFEADRARRIDFESSTYVRAFDFRPTYELATRDRIARFREWLRTTQ